MIVIIKCMMLLGLLVVVTARQNRFMMMRSCMVNTGRHESIYMEKRKRRPIYILYMYLLFFCFSLISSLCDKYEASARNKREEKRSY